MFLVPVKGHPKLPTPWALRQGLGRRLLHALRATGALQLAAASAARDQNPGSLEVVCLDPRVAAAAQREGRQLVEVG